MPDVARDTVVITGASSGIGRALAFEMARRGHALGLVARRLPLLEKLRDELRTLEPPRIELATLDVCQVDRVAPTLRELFERLGGVDTVVINAGVNELTDPGGRDLGTEIRLIETNLVGAIATFSAAVEHLLERGRGHIVGISSLASLQPLPRQAAYCASKAGFSMYLKSARIDLKGRGIAITDIRPGYVATEIVEGVDISRLPFAIPAEQAAREMARLIERRVRTGIVPAFPWRWLRPLLGHLPERIARV